MRWTSIILLLLGAHHFAAALFAADPGLGGTNTLGTNAMHQARIQGTNSLATFKALITTGNFQVLGFSSTNEVAQATNAEPILVYSVRFNQLKTFQPGQSVSNLLGPIDRLMIPVLVNGEVRSSLTLRVVQGPTMWTNENWGQPRLVRDLVQTISLIPAGDIGPNSDPFAVQVPVFNMWFIAHWDATGQVVARATVPLPQFGLQRSDVIPAGVLTELSTKAQQYPGPP